MSISTSGTCWRHTPLTADVIVQGVTTVSIDTDQDWIDAGCPNMETLLRENRNLIAKVERLRGVLLSLCEWDAGYDGYQHNVALARVIAEARSAIDDGGD